MKNAKDVAALKAVSQNLMHKNLSITDGIYGILSETDVRKQISMLGRMPAINGEDDIYEVLEKLLVQRKMKSSK